MIIYLHGFNSGGQSHKAAWLRAQLAPVPVFAPTYPAHRSHEALRVLRKFIRRLRRENPHSRKLMLIGSSLGGFWAQQLAPEFGACIVLINPSMRPDETLARHTGRFHNEATGEETVLTAQDVLALKTQRVEPCNPKVPTLLLLDAGDEVLDYRIAETALRGCGKTIVYPGGSHRFEHLAEALPEIRALYAACASGPPGKKLAILMLSGPCAGIKNHKTEANMAGWISLGVVVLLLVFIVGLYNRLVTLRNRVKNAFAQIDVQLTRRHDLIPNLVEAVKGYIKHERETLEAVIQARNVAMAGLKAVEANPTNAQAMQQLGGAETALTGALSRLMVVAEAYPDLKANQNMMQLTEELSSTENRVAFSRQGYNDSVMDYNNACETFPSGVIANLFRFTPGTMLEIEDAAKRAVPKVSFS